MMPTKNGTYRDTRERGRQRDRRKAAKLIVLADSPGNKREPIKTRIGNAARKLGWPYRRVEDIWRGEAHRIDGWELDTLRALDAGTQKNKNCP